MSLGSNDCAFSCDTLVDLLRHRAAHTGSSLAYRFLETGDVDGHTSTLTYEELEQQARAVAAALQAMDVCGERVLLLFPPGLGFISAFFGCLFAGAVAVPVYPPKRNRRQLRLTAVASDCSPAVVLAAPDIADDARASLAASMGLAEERWLTLDAAVAHKARAWRAPEVTEESLAFLQYTSGSTGMPKGVMVTHRNLLHNQRLMQCCFESDETTTVVGWLPLFHDMGLIGNVLHPMFLGSCCTLMSPFAFLQKPVRWLQAISHYAGRLSGGPNFAYGLCTQQVRDDDKATLDLSGWTTAVVGSEPIRPATMEAFVEAFRDCGFRRTSLLPCYGLAESTLFATGGTKTDVPVVASINKEAVGQGLAVDAQTERADAVALVSSGTARLDQRVVVVDPDKQLCCEAGRVGEIWIRGPSVAQGYWGREEETRRAFDARLVGEPLRGFMRTGDLGFIRDANLFVTGRLKDLIIIRGRNHYPQDIEATVEACHPNIRTHCSAAFSVESDDGESLVIAAEVNKRDSTTLRDICSAVRREVAKHHAIRVAAIVLLRSHTIPKTSSGKIERHACRSAFLEGTLNRVAGWRFDVIHAVDAGDNDDIGSDPKDPTHSDVQAYAESKDTSAAQSSVSPSPSNMVIELRALAPDARGGVLQAALRKRAARVLGLDSAQEISLHRPLQEWGLDSLTAVELGAELSEMLGTKLPATVVFDHPTLEALCDHLLTDVLGLAHGCASTSGRTVEVEPCFAAPRTASLGASAPAPLEAVQRRSRWAVSQFEAAHRPDSLVGWRTFFLPSELFHATGMLSMIPESACALVARNQSAIEASVEAAEEAGYDLKLCSFLKTTIGGTLNGLLPRPKVVVGGSCFCAGTSAVLHDAARYLDAPFFYLNLPMHSDSEDAIDYVAKQLRDLAVFLCRHSGLELREMERERLPRAIEQSQRASRYWEEVTELRKAIPSPMSGREALQFATVLSDGWGSEEMADIYKLLRDELQQRVSQGISATPHEIVRLLWIHLRPYHSDDMMRLIEEAGGAVVFEAVNARERMVVRDRNLYRVLARQAIANAMKFQTFSSRMRDVMCKMASEFNADGVIHFAQDNCDWNKSVSPSLHRLLRDDLKLPFLNIDGDCLINGRHKLQKTRLLGFLEGMLARKTGHTVPFTARRPGHVLSPIVLSGVNREDREHGGSSGGLRYVGVDVGSTSAKVVVLDAESRLVETHVIPTIKLHEGALEKTVQNAISENGWSIGAMVATGVGGSNVPFEHSEATEMTCHTRGCLHHFPTARSIIDIGGQDTKAILVREAVYRMNVSCAAGTGRFLEVIAAALGLKIAEMVELDSSARHSVPISKVCTVFAESEVVNRIASGSDRGEIVRGVHEMVADKAVGLLRRISKEIAFPVVLSGGVALNAGVVRALETRLGTKILVPPRPQIVGALGAALIAMERQHPAVHLVDNRDPPNRGSRSASLCPLQRCAG